MMNFKTFFIGVLAWIWVAGTSMYGQELNFKVTVDKIPAVSLVKADPQFLPTLAKNIEEFLNTTQWGEDRFKDHEKIKGNLLLIITEETPDRVYKAELSIQTERPVYYSTYVTPILNIKDNFIVFPFNEMSVLQKTSSTFYDNLSSILSFYAYMVIGIDYDSFKVNSGDGFYKKAYDVVQGLPTGFQGDEGWKLDQSSKKNRYWMVENALSPNFRQFRQAFYEYHRQGLDKMYSEPDKSRAVVLSALTSIGQGNLDYPNGYLTQIFSDAKKDEIIEIFKVADKGQKEKVKTIMTGIDISRNRDYDVLN